MKWRYKVIDEIMHSNNTAYGSPFDTLEGKLNCLGEAGWEVISVQWSFPRASTSVVLQAICKHPLEELA